MIAVVLLGPPGAGKGTVAEVLIDRGYRHVSTGNLLREQIQLETPLGLEAKALIDDGKLVPDGTVLDMVRERLSSEPVSARFLFDGFPRTLTQAYMLDDLISSLNGNLEDVLLLECPDDVIVERLAGRRTCSKCGAVYHMAFNPPERGQLCNKDGCGLSQRSDDSEETIRERLRIYKKRTVPIIEYYGSRDLIHSIDAAQSIEEVRQAALARLDGDGIL